MRFTLGYQVLTAVILAIFTGLFFGPFCSILKPVAMGFTMLLQLIVLPYICFSLIHGLGSLPVGTGRKLFKIGWPFLLTVWLIAYFLMGAIAQLIPKSQEVVISISPIQSNANLLENFVQYIIPKNFFFDFLNNIVPAVAIFGVITGLALMHMEKKEPLINFVERINKIIEKVLYWLALISPIGAFAHIALAVGTVSFDDLYKIEFFVICYIGLCVFITFWILPILVSCLIPMSFKEVLDAIRKVCLLPFVTGLAPFAIPFINSYLRELAKKYEEKDATFHDTSQTILPLAYSFGQIGNCIALYFLFFLSYYYRHPFTLPEEALLCLLSIPLGIGTTSSTLNSVAFMIEHFHFPPSAFVLFTETSALTVNFQVLVAISSVLSLILLTLHGYYGVLRVKWGALISRLGVIIAIFCAVIASIKPMISIQDNYKNLYMNLKISDVIPDPVETTIYTNVGKEDPIRNPEVSTLEQIVDSRVLKVGYDLLDTPYSYRNQNNELVGFDISYAYKLAKDLDCKLEFIPSNFNALEAELEAGIYDIAMCGILITEERLANLNFTLPYLEDNMTLVVPWAKRKSFMDLQSLLSRQDLKIAAIGGYKEYFNRHFPNGSYISLNDPSELDNWDFDAWLVLKTTGFIWCLSHPDYVTIDYEGLIGKGYHSYPIRDSSHRFAFFLNNWLLIKQLEGFYQQMVDYWIEGELHKKEQPRWSILRNVLHLVD